jgi:polyhydroxybutyrate depolymerase
MQFDGLERSYDIVAPASSEPLPVIVAFHGFTQSSELHREMTGLGDAALERGFIAVFPMGSIPDGASQPYFNLATTDDESLSDDIGLTEAILADVASEHCVDETRIYATGWSNGGMLASTLACELPDRFAAVASVSGVVLRDDCPDDPVPIIILHGTTDSLVPYTDAPSDYMYETVISLGANEAQAAMFAEVDEDPDDYIAQWVAQNGCQADPLEVGDSGYDISEYQGCDQGSGVETVLLEFGGHRWTEYPTELILDFFSEHQLPAG